MKRNVYTCLPEHTACFVSVCTSAALTAVTAAALGREPTVAETEKVWGELKEAINNYVATYKAELTSKGIEWSEDSEAKVREQLELDISGQIWLMVRRVESELTKRVRSSEKWQKGPLYVD